MYVLGGGLGRDGGGISEPITAKSIFGREGLGKDIFQLSSNRILFYFVQTRPVQHCTGPPKEKLPQLIYIQRHIKISFEFLDPSHIRFICIGSKDKI